jgi:hypothetical protein
MRLQIVVTWEPTCATDFEAGLKHLEGSIQDRWQPTPIHLNRSEIGLSLQVADFDLDGAQTSLIPKYRKSQTSRSE